MLSGYNDTEKLIHCTVTNRYNEQSSRFVELNNFRLWEFLMTNKHQTRITDLHLCLWLSQEEYATHESVYSRSGETEQVNRVIVDLFDEEYGFSNPVVPYVRSSETDKVIQILTSHIPQQIIDSDNCTIIVHEGYSITQRQHVDKGDFMKGLEKEASDLS